MPMQKRSDSFDETEALEREVQRLRKELESIRVSSFNSIRDLEIQHRAAIEAQIDAHAEEIKSLTTKHRLALALQRQEAQDSASQTLEETLKSAQALWQKATDAQLEALRQDHERTRAGAVEVARDAARREWQSELEEKVNERLAAAAEQWAAAEKERLMKLKVDLTHEKSMAITERDAFWKAELARLAPGHELAKHAQRHLDRPEYRDPRNASVKDSAKTEGRARPALPVVLILLFLGAAAAYLFAPQWQPAMRSMSAPILAHVDVPLKNAIYGILPWLIPDARPQYENAPPATFVKSSAANVRNGPNLSAPVLGVIHQGDRVTVIEQKNGWARIRLPNAADETGWIHESLLREGTAPVDTQR